MTATLLPELWRVQITITSARGQASRSKHVTMPNLAARNTHRQSKPSREMDSHLLVVPGVSTFLEGSQDESGVVA